MSPPLLHAFVDETGDRGVTPKSSPFFSTATLLVPGERLHDLNLAVDDLHAAFSVPPTKALHWAAHAKNWTRRNKAASRFAGLPDIQTIYVIFEKASLNPASVLRTDSVKFYNYVAGYTLERIVRAADLWPGGGRDVVVNFGHVKGFDHSLTRSYFTLKPFQQCSARLPWHRIHGGFHGVKFLNMHNSSGLQAADCYAGMLKAAIVPDQFGYYESSYFLQVAHQVWRSNTGCALGNGFKVMAPFGVIQALPWWAQSGF